MCRCWEGGCGDGKLEEVEPVREPVREPLFILAAAGGAVAVVVAGAAVVVVVVVVVLVLGAADGVIGPVEEEFARAEEGRPEGVPADPGRTIP